MNFLEEFKNLSHGLLHGLLHGILSGVLGVKPLGEGVADKTGANGVSEDLGARGRLSPPLWEKWREIWEFLRFFKFFLRNFVKNVFFESLL